MARQSTKGDLIRCVSHVTFVRFRHVPLRSEIAASDSRIVLPRIGNRQINDIYINDIKLKTAVTVDVALGL